MKLTKSALRGMVLGGTVALFTTTASGRDWEDLEPPAPPPEYSVVAQDTLQIHSTMQDDRGLYARDLYLAYVRSPEENLNRLAERGLANLVIESHRRTSVEPAGVVGINLETDDLSFFPMLLFQIEERTPRLSETARLKLQEYMNNGGFLIIDLQGGRVNSSNTLNVLLDDLQIGAAEPLVEGHALTQSFYLVSNLPGVNDRGAWVEADNAATGERSQTSILIGANNWAGAWSALMASPETSETAIRSGLNMLLYALSGNYKTDPMHEETIIIKREFQEQQRLSTLQETPAP